MKKFHCFIDFHFDSSMGGLMQVQYLIVATDHESAFKAAMSLLDMNFSGMPLKNINLYESRL